MWVLLYRESINIFDCLNLFVTVKAGVPFVLLLLKVRQSFTDETFRKKYFNMAEFER